MEMLRYYVDQYYYTPRDEDSFVIKGWALPYPFYKAPTLKVYRDEETVPIKVQWYDRPDLENVGLEVPEGAHPGFTLKIIDITQWIFEAQTILLRVYYEGQEKAILQLDCQELITQMFEESLSYKVDLVDYQDGDLIVQGWMIDQCCDNEILVFNDQHEQIPCILHRLARPDVEDQYPDRVERQEKIGFYLQITGKDIRTEIVHLVFRNRCGYRRYDINFFEMKRKTTQAGRLFNVLRPNRFEENREMIRQEGLTAFTDYVKKAAFLSYSEHSLWVKAHRLSREEEEAQKAQDFPEKPLISIVIPLYHTPTRYLKEMIDSIFVQTYPRWEICLADGSKNRNLGRFLKRHYRRDPRIHYQYLGENLGISGNTNKAIEMACGDYLLFADHDDLIEQGALFEIAKKIHEHPKADMIYTDEDKISRNGKAYFEPAFKSDFNPFMLECNNYICHILVVSRRLVDQVKGLCSDYDGAQDYDFILRCWEVARKNEIYHIPKILYHWRIHPSSTAGNPESKPYAYEAGARALDAHFARIGADATAQATDSPGFYKIHRPIHDRPLVSILIPNQDHKDDLDKCLSSVTENSTWDHYEILVIENNSQEQETWDYYKEMTEKYPMCRLLVWEGPFNFAAINNFAAKEAAGEYLLFLNNDVNLITEDWIEEMLGICQLPQVGAVGARLLYPDGTIQHAGVILGLGGVAGHIFSGQSDNGRSNMVQNLMAVTAACMMVSAGAFRQIGGFDEDFAVAYNDVDLCLKLRQAGYQIVYTPYARLYHYESKSRGSENTPEKEQRLQKEADRLEQKWKDVFAQPDPYYNVNLLETSKTR